MSVVVIQLLTVNRGTLMLPYHDSFLWCAVSYCPPVIDIHVHHPSTCESSLALNYQDYVLGKQPFWRLLCRARLYGPVIALPLPLLQARTIGPFGHTAVLRIVRYRFFRYCPTVVHLSQCTGYKIHLGRLQKVLKDLLTTTLTCENCMVTECRTRHFSNPNSSRRS